MNIKKVLIILLFPFITELVVACCPDCDDPIIGHYTNKTLSVSNIDNSGIKPEIANGNPIPKEAFGIRVRLGREKTACLTPRRSLFIQTAYARTCHCPPENEFLAKDSVTAIQIFTSADFDANHPAHADISEYFKVFKNNSFTTISNHLEKHSTVVNYEDEFDWTFDLVLMTPPTKNINHSFRVKITLSDNRVLESETIPIDLI